MAEEAATEVVDLKPEDCVCFGTIDPKHPECQKCQFKEPCAVKAAGK